MKVVTVSKEEMTLSGLLNEAIRKDPRGKEQYAFISIPEQMNGSSIYIVNKLSLNDICCYYNSVRFILVKFEEEPGDSPDSDGWL